MAQKRSGMNIGQMSNQTVCQTNYELGQFNSNSIRTIEVVEQGYRNSNGVCVFDVRLFVPDHLEDYLGENIKWKIDGVSVPGNERQISVPVPGDNVVVFVTYTINTQEAAASRTF